VASYRGVERRSDSDTRERIDGVQRRVTIIMLAQVMVLLLLVAGTFYFRGEQDQNVRQARAIALAVQRSRVEAATRVCVQTNKRNQNGRHVFKQLLAARRSAVHTPAELERLKRSEAGTDKLIDALFPPQDCPRVVALQTHVPLIDAVGP
jgi:hypothetical protein